MTPHDLFATLNAVSVICFILVALMGVEDPHRWTVRDSVASVALVVALLGGSVGVLGYVLT